MLRISKVSTIAVVLGLGIFLGGCSLVAKPADVTTESPTKVIKGILTGGGGKYYIKDEADIATEVDSRKVDLSKFLGSEIEAEGEFSGTTLFIDSIRAN